jgi:hypothetical protein
MTSKLSALQLSNVLILCAGLFLSGAGACLGAAQDQSDRKQESSKAASPETDEDRAVKATYWSVRHNHLTTLRDQCLAYDFSEDVNKAYFVVDVWENHRPAVCGGGPQTSPCLFTFHIDKKTGSLTTDAKSPDGNFHPIAK